MSMWERCKAWYRGETVVAGATRGRCYQKKSESPKGGSKAQAKPTVKLVGVTITRADGSTEEIK